VTIEASGLKRIATTLLVAAVLIVCATSASADTYTFTTLPDPGLLTAAPGSTTGWGYSITNNSATNWLVVYGLSAGTFPGSTVNPYFFDMPSIAPGASRIVPYNPFSPYGYAFMAAHGFPHPVDLTLAFDPVTNPSNALGLYQVILDPSVADGTVYSGNFVIKAAWFNDNLDTNPSAQLVGSAPDGSASYSLVVTPEPASLTLAGMGFLALAFRARKKQSQNLS
jgi:hypothetical protein